MEKRTRTRRKDTRPAEIVECAMKLFVERGYFETNFQDIADAGNLARSTIYLYFKDKKSILKAALEKKFEENKNILMDFPKEQNDTFQERMVKLLSRMQKITLDDSFKRFCVMMSGLSAKDPEIAKIWKKEIFDKLKNVGLQYVTTSISTMTTESMYSTFSILSFLCPVQHLSALERKTPLWIL